MLNNRRPLFLFLTVLFIASVAATVAWRTQRGAAQEGVTKGEEPVADYTAAEPADLEKRAKRENRSRHYDKSGLVIEPRVKGGDIVRRSASARKLPALPTGRSDAVVIGEVTDAQAYLSNDKSGVYTEFTISIAEALKDNSGLVQTGVPLVAQRAGGRVRFQSGVVQRYGIDKLGVPHSGRRYVLFLKKLDADEVFAILTGYELRGGGVHPLDGGGGGLPQFTRYEGMSEAEFLAEVRDAINNPL